MPKTGLVKLYNRFRELILYAVFGGFSAFMDFIVYLVLVWLTMPFYIANSISVTVGILISFLLNRNFNFKINDRPLLRFAIFFSVGLSGLVLSNCIIYILINVLAIDYIVAKLMSIVIVALYQFLLNKYVTFKKLIIK